ncbi:MAG: hypothetical protein E6X17_10440 [Sporomusaceae bacterium]|nr:hypothetical protein [Sporomusaceae bacterium]
MAASVIMFPKRTQPSESELEGLLRKWLTELEADEAVAGAVTARMLAYIEQYAARSFQPAFNLPVPPGFSPVQAEALLQAIETGMDNVAREVQELINRIIIERFFLELELCERANRCKPCLNKPRV